MGPNCGILEILGLSVNAQKLDGLLCWNLCIKFYVGMYENGNSYGNRFQKLEPM